MVKRFASDGTPLRGDRTINEAQAATVRHIFYEYAGGKSSKAIAKQLNREGVRGPSGKGWGPSKIHGNRERGTGILNNELYIGRLVWNRLRYLKDPETGKRVSRQNPDSALIVNDVPALRIVEQALWDKVKARQQGLKDKQAKDKAGFWDRRRPRYIFSGLMKCGECGGGFVKISEHYFGCATARNKGTCGNLTAIKRDVLEETVLGGLQQHLMDPTLIDIFCVEYTRHLNRLRSDAVASLEGWKAELGKIDREMERLVDAIVGGVPASKVKDRMIELDARKSELDGLIATAPEAPAVLVHPSMGERYRQAVTRLREALNEPARRAEAAEIIRGLIDCIVLRPEGDGRKKALTIDLTGHLAGILNVAGAARDGVPASDRQTKLVAGTRFEPTSPCCDSNALAILGQAGDQVLPIRWLESGTGHPGARHGISPEPAGTGPWASTASVLQCHTRRNEVSARFWMERLSGNHCGSVGRKFARAYTLKVQAPGSSIPKEADHSRFAPLKRCRTANYRQ